MASTRPAGVHSLMYDAVPEGVPFIPADAPIVAGYGDGLYQSLPLLVRRFGGKAHISSIGVWTGHLFEWTDVEPGNPIDTPEKVRADFEHRKAHDVWRPGFYGDLTRMRDTIIPGLSGVPREEYRLWLADWDGNENFIPLPGGVEAAKQFRSETHFDVSVVNILAFLGPRTKHVSHLRHNIGHKPAQKPPKLSGGVSPVRPKGIVPRVRHVAHKIARGSRLHPKSAGGVGGGGLGAALVAILVGSGVHITPTEAAGVATITSLALSWLVPSPPPDVASLLTTLEDA